MSKANQKLHKTDDGPTKYEKEATQKVTKKIAEQLKGSKYI